MRGWMTLVALLFTLPLQADVIEDLYLTTVPVESQDLSLIHI